jgi:HSP20 family molecular chaperone IbpA
MSERNLTISHDENRSLRPYEDSTRSARPAVDIFENEDAWIFMADMPGVNKDRLDVNIDQDVLTLRGRVEEKTLGENLLREFTTEAYMRQFQLPGDIDADKAEASMKNGVLTLRLPKSEAAKPRRIEITTH